MSWHDLQPVVVFFVCIISSTLSGMAGGGGGFIITPFFIWLGLTPQQAVVTGKFGAFGLYAGAVSAFRKRMLDDKKFSLFIITLSLVTGITAALILKNIDSKPLQILMGALMLGMLPLMAQSNKDLLKPIPSNSLKAIGTALMIVILLLQGVLSSGVGALVSAILIIFFGKTAIEANILKRKSSIVVSGVVVLALFSSGLINFKFGFAAMAGGLIGGYLGSKTALKKGDNFARYALMIFMVISGIWLILSA
jgi:uncharacterized membrane protein YfcA